MNEFDYIKKYLEKSGAYRLVDISYYNESLSFSVSKTVLMGVIAGANAGFTYCFGNLEVSILEGGTIVLTNGNRFWTKVTTALPNLNEPGSYENYLSIGSGMNLLGTGAYYGYKRFYGLGFNRIDFASVDIGAATFNWSFNFNGYMFRLK